MSETSTAAQLFIVAIQDLCDGERAWTEHLPALEAKTSNGLTRYASEERERAVRQCTWLEEIARHLDVEPTDAPNLWLRAILDDAERDSRTIVRGVLRDIALTGAFRKGKQSERVSYETAIGLAHATGQAEFALTLTRIRDEEAAADAQLARILEGLLQEIS